MSTTPIDRSACTANRHGNYSAYRKGCRCADARESKRLYYKRTTEGRHQPLLVDSIGANRRLQALSANDWSITELGARLNTNPRRVQVWRTGTNPIRRSTNDRITALYEELANTPGPSPITGQRAAAYGWVKPARWEDVDIDDPNSQPEATAPESGRRPVAVLVEDFDDLVAKGLSEAQAAAQLGIKPESIGQARRRVKVSAARKSQTVRKQAAA